MPQHETLPLFDLVQVEQFTHGSQELIRRLFTEIRDSNNIDLPLLIRAAANGDRAEVARLCHKTRGAAQIIQAEALVMCCKRIENDCAEGIAATELLLRVAELQRQIEALNKAMFEALEAY